MSFSTVLSCGPTVMRMTEPPRPPGEEPTRPFDPYSSNDPQPGSTPPPPPAYGAPEPPAYGSPQPPAYGAPYGSPEPSSGAGGYAPPPSSGAGGYAPPPSSGAGGYGPPPGSGAPGYGAGPAYGAPAGGPGPVGYPGDEDKNWALLAHFGPIIIGFLAPLIALLARGPQSPTVRAHAVEALNFHITWGIATVIASILAICTFGVLFFLPIITYVVAVVFSIIGGMKANEGVLYRYPMTVRLVN
jgi:uncharacterized Tic20 family protein